MYDEGQDIWINGKKKGRVVKVVENGHMLHETGTKKSRELSEKTIDRVYANAYRAELDEDEMFLCVFIRKASKKDQDKQTQEEKENGTLLETEVVARVKPEFNDAFLHSLREIAKQLKGGAKEAINKDASDLLEKVLKDIEKERKKRSKEKE